MLDVLFAIVIIAILSVIIFFIYKEYTNSRSFRVRKSVKNYKRLKKEEEKTILKYKNDANEILSDEDRILSVIKKINSGEEVKIPIAAFQYIYTRLNQICVVDKNGNVQIVNSEEFKRFQETAITLLDKDNEILKDASSNLNEELLNVFTTKKYPDGTIIKKNNVNGDVTILKPDGTKYINKNELNDLIIERPYEEDAEEKNKKNKGKKDVADDVNKLKNENKNFVQENSYLKKQIEEFERKEKGKNSIDNINKKADVEIEIFNDKKFNNQTKESENNSEIEISKNKSSATKYEQVLIEKDTNNLLNIIEKKDNEDGVSLSNNDDNTDKSIYIDKTKNNQKILSQDNNSDIQNKSQEKDVLEVIDPLYGLESIMEKYKNISNPKRKIKDDVSENIPLLDDENSKSTLKNIIEERKSLSVFDIEKRLLRSMDINYISIKQFFDEVTSKDKIIDMLLFILSVNNKRYSNYFVYVHTEKKIYISIDMLIFKLSCYLNDNDRDIFFNDIKPKGLNTCDFQNDLLLPFIKNVNKYFAFKMGFKPFYLNEEKEIFYVQKFTEFIYGEENKKYFKGAFVILNIKNDLEQILKDNNYLDKFEPYKSYFVESVNGNTGLLHIDRIIEMKQEF